MRRVLITTTAAAIALTVSLAAEAQDKITFPSTDGDLLGGKPTVVTGYLYRPQGLGPFPAVVGMHGCNGVVDTDGTVRPLYGTWGEVLSREGYLVLLPDSFGSRGHGDLCAMQPNQQPVQPAREIPRDSYGALAYLRSRSDVRPNSVAILGQSYGAGAMFHTIAVDTLPKDVLPEHDFRAAVAFYPGCQRFLTREPTWLPRVPLLFLMGEADNFTPPAPCKELLSRLAAGGAPPVESHFYPNVYHAFDHPNSPLRVLTNVKLPPDGHSPTVGTNKEARDDAILRVKQFLAAKLR